MTVSTAENLQRNAKRPGNLTVYQATYCRELILNHKSQSEAIRAAGYKGKCENVASYHLMRLPAVQVEIARLQRELEAQAKVKAETFVKILVEQVQGAGMGKYLNAEGELLSGPALKALGSLLAVEQIKDTTFKGVTTRTIKLRDPVPAIALLSKLLGWEKAAEEADGDKFNLILNLGGPPQNEPV